MINSLHNIYTTRNDEGAARSREACTWPAHRTHSAPRTITTRKRGRRFDNTHGLLAFKTNTQAAEDAKMRSSTTKKTPRQGHTTLHTLHDRDKPETQINTYSTRLKAWYLDAHTLVRSLRPHSPPSSSPANGTISCTSSPSAPLPPALPPPFPTGLRHPRLCAPPSDR